MTYFNPPSVAITLTWMGDTYNPYSGLLCIRRKLKDGFGKVALPGGYQEDETLQEAAAREHEEETGIAIDPRNLSLFSCTTVDTPEGKRNLIFFVHDFHKAPLAVPSTFLETAEAIPFIWQPKVNEQNVAFKELNDDWAFPTHLDAAYHYYMNTRN